jgi:hypothetical protein
MPLVDAFRAIRAEFVDTHELWPIIEDRSPGVRILLTFVVFACLIPLSCWLLFHMRLSTSWPGAISGALTMAAAIAWRDRQRAKQNVSSE